MRILYIDIDSLRPDHLSCYGYHRAVSPHIDRIAAEGVRFENCYVSESPCLPSRTAFFSGRFGIRTGVASHGGAAADPFPEGAERESRRSLESTSLAAALRDAGYLTAGISSFAEAHSAWHYHAGFNHLINPGRRGEERADEVSPLAIDWLKRHGKSDKWFLHVNFWDTHTPYRTPPDFGHPFKNDPPPGWLTEEIRRHHWQGFGPHSAQEIAGYDISDPQLKSFPRQPVQAGSMADVKRLFDGYDTAVKYVDEHIGRIIKTLDDLKVLDQTAIVVSADHGENLGELNIYADHQTADHCTHRVPMIVRFPGLAHRVDGGLHYQFDIGATLLELAGAKVPSNWDGTSIASSLRAGKTQARPYLVMTHCAWTCQRALRFDEYQCIRTWHAGHHPFPDLMIFNVVNDPAELHDLAERRPDLGVMALAMLDQWTGEMMKSSPTGVDPLWTTLREGGPFYTRGMLDAYLQRLRKTGRPEAAKRLAETK